MASINALLAEPQCKAWNRQANHFSVFYFALNPGFAPKNEVIVQFHKLAKLAKLAFLAFIALLISHYLIETTLVLDMTFKERAPDWLSVSGGDPGSYSNWEAEVMTGFFMLAIGALLTLRTLQRLIADLRGEPKRSRLVSDWIDERAQNWLPVVASAWQKSRDTRYGQIMLARPPLTAFAIILMTLWTPLFLLSIWLFG